MSKRARRLRCCFLAAFLPVAGCSVVSEPGQSAARVAVTYVNPEHFTDARRAELAPTSQGILDELRRFLAETGARFIPENMKLDIRITDIDLAGDFELFRGPQADQVRIGRGLYPPRITLEFELLDGNATPVRSGRRTLTDIDYQTRRVYPRDDYLRYEKELLREWLRAKFGGSTSRTVPTGTGAPA
jgi:hypothetical protein